MNDQIAAIASAVELIERVEKSFVTKAALAYGISQCGHLRAVGEKGLRGWFVSIVPDLAQGSADEEFDLRVAVDALAAPPRGIDASIRFRCSGCG
jgi:hypothetical protein